MPIPYTGNQYFVPGRPYRPGIDPDPTAPPAQGEPWMPTINIPGTNYPFVPGRSPGGPNPYQTSPYTGEPISGPPINSGPLPPTSNPNYENVLPTMVNFPTHLYPTSGSSGTASGFNMGGSTGQSYGTSVGGSIGQSGGTSTSRSRSSTYSGLDPRQRKALMGTLMPELTRRIAGYDKTLADKTRAATNLYQNMIRTGLDESMKGQIDELTRRGILSSTEAQELMSKAAQDIILGGAGKGYEAAITEAVLQAQAPQMFADIANLGQYTKGSSTSRARSQQQAQNQSFNQALNEALNQSYTLGGNQSQQQSFSENPLAPYTLISNLMQGLM